jgi:DNA-binding helix-hairpin-helix protein with protein kinase domain
MTDELDRSVVGTLGAQLGSGGQANVYLAPQLTLPDVAGPLVFKQYKGDQVSQNGLRAIVGVRSRLDPGARARLDAMAVWPVRVVRDSGRICGVLMPLIPDSFFQDRILPTGTRSRDPREVQNLFIEPDRAVRLGMPDLSTTQRFAVCRDLAAVLALLHGNGVVFGDVNARNELFRAHPEPTVMLVDCDAVRIRGSAAVVKQLSAPDWNPPEGAVLTQATDLYKLGLFITRVLSPGRQASTARDPQRAFAHLDGEGRRLLTDALGAAGASRPTADIWRAYFAKRVTPANGARLVNAAVAPRPAEPAVVTSGWRRDPATGRWVPAR